MSYGDLKIISSSKFLKLEANIPHDIRLLDESPLEVFKHQDKKGQVTCTAAQAACGYCAIGDIPRQKFITNVFDYSVGRVLLWEFGNMVATQLKSIDKSLTEQKAKIIETDLKVEATGEGFDRKYTITPRMISKTPPTGLVLHKVSDLPF